MNNKSFLTCIKLSAPGQDTGDWCWIFQLTRCLSQCGRTELGSCPQEGLCHTSSRRNRKHTKLFESRSKGCEKTEHEEPVVLKKEVTWLLLPFLFNPGGSRQGHSLSFKMDPFHTSVPLILGWLFSLLPFPGWLTSPESWHQGRYPLLPTYASQRGPSDQLKALYVQGL